jgi:formylglycine-generating enzyme required for sulfatase activity
VSTRTRSTCSSFLVVVGVTALTATPLGAASDRCPPDSVRVGPVCVDKYEASVWSIPVGNARLRKLVQRGKATLADLTAGGATQVSPIPMDACTGLDYGPSFPPDGNWTAPLYAVSVPGVPPSTCATWFQANQACRLAGKRLVANDDWQAAAAGTPDPDDDDDGATTCATNSAFAALTGSRSACVSRWGTHDMAGNVWEWVGGWLNAATGCTNWDATHGGDMSCISLNMAEPPPPENLVGPVPRELVSFDPNLPGAVIRGGNYAAGARNGIFAVYAAVNPSNISRSTGFRCAR